MADEQPSLHIDTDWKKQAQEEKRKLAEAAAKAKSTAVAVPGAAVASPSGAKPAPVAPPNAKARGGRGLPAPGFGSLVQSVMTQILYYLGELPQAGGQAAIDLDLAKHHLDTLGMLEEKTKNNLTLQEQSTLDAALYETRTRFVNVAMQFLGP